MKFLDEFLQNIRKFNDVYKLDLLSDSKVQLLNNNSENGAIDVTSLPIKKTMSLVLDIVLRIFVRLSYSMESDTEYFSMQFY